MEIWSNTLWLVVITCCLLIYILTNFLHEKVVKINCLYSQLILCFLMLESNFSSKPMENKSELVWIQVAAVNCLFTNISPKI